MIIAIEQDTINKRSNFLKSDLKKYLFNKVIIAGESKNKWFKGSRYR